MMSEAARGSLPRGRALSGLSVVVEDYKKLRRLVSEPWNLPIRLETDGEKIIASMDMKIAFDMNTTSLNQAREAAQGMFKWAIMSCSEHAV